MALLAANEHLPLEGGVSDAIVAQAGPDAIR
jgi:hypothetical protein